VRAGERRKGRREEKQDRNVNLSVKSSLEYSFTQILFGKTYILQNLKGKVTFLHHVFPLKMWMGPLLLWKSFLKPSYEI
jgi:hypothetical protein